MRRRFRRGVRLRRLVRRFELWSVLRVALFFHLFCFLLTLAALVVVWQIASSAGLVKNIETFLGDIGFDGKGSKSAAEGPAQDITLDGQVLLRAAAAIGGVIMVLNTLGTVVMAFFYNMISGMFGGVVMSVLEEIPRPPRLPKQSANPNGGRSPSRPSTTADDLGTNPPASDQPLELASATEPVEATEPLMK